MTEFQKADLDGDGSISQREMEIYLEAKRREMEDEDAKRDQQRKMVWFALFGMLGYPLFVFASGALGFDNESKIIGDMSGSTSCPLAWWYLHSSVPTRTSRAKSCLLYTSPSPRD